VEKVESIFESLYSIKEVTRKERAAWKKREEELSKEYNACYKKIEEIKSSREYSIDKISNIISLQKLDDKKIAFGSDENAHIGYISLLSYIAKDFLFKRDSFYQKACLILKQYGTTYEYDCYGDGEHVPTYRLFYVPYDSSDISNAVASVGFTPEYRTTILSEEERELCLKTFISINPMMLLFRDYCAKRDKERN
jgi:hypothetical protein